LAVEKIENQLRKEKEKIQNHHHPEHTHEAILTREMQEQARSYRMAAGDPTKKR
jgi:ribosome-associated translation inhibitor RaiA